MKRLMIVFAMFLIFMFPLVSACTLTATLVNQDPYPAIPGEYVNLLFQLNGVEDPSCGQVTFELLENYPISFDPGVDSKVTVTSGTFQKDFGSFLTIPYKVRIDQDALDGDNKVEVRFTSGTIPPLEQLKTFVIEVEDARADFELHVDDYSSTNKELTLEILNIAESDVEALTLEIPAQENVKLFGTNRVVVGDLDSNEFTTADFDAELKDGEITINIIYSDTTGTRRQLQKQISFESSYFQETKSSSSSSYIIYVIIFLVVVYFGYRYYKKKKSHHSKHHHHKKARSSFFG